MSTRTIYLTDFQSLALNRRIEADRCERRVAPLAPCAHNLNLLEKSTTVRDGFEKFIRKRISGEGDVLELASGAKFLALVLAEKEPRAKLVEEYIRELTGDSLQSAEEILRTATALGLENKSLGLDISRLKEIFSIRNKIIHELDLDLNAPKRKRKVRSQADLLDNSDLMLETIKKILEALDKTL